jgi:hypothetical protein
VFLSELGPESAGRSVRVVGRLRDYDGAKDMGVLEDRGARVVINTRLVVDVPLRDGAMVMCIGEIERNNNENVLLVRVARLVDGLDVALYTKAIEVARGFFQGQK